jgi:hypothetical protein
LCTLERLQSLTDIPPPTTDDLTPLPEEVIDTLLNGSFGELIRTIPEYRRDPDFSCFREGRNNANERWSSKDKFIAAVSYFFAPDQSSDDLIPLFDYPRTIRAISTHRARFTIPNFEKRQKEHNDSPLSYLLHLFRKWRPPMAHPTLDGTGVRGKSFHIVGDGSIQRNSKGFDVGGSSLAVVRDDMTVMLSELQCTPVDGCNDINKYEGSYLLWAAAIARSLLHHGATGAQILTDSLFLSSKITEGSTHTLYTQMASILPNPEKYVVWRNCEYNKLGDSLANKATKANPDGIWRRHTPPGGYDASHIRQIFLDHAPPVHPFLSGDKVADALAFVKAFSSDELLDSPALRYMNGVPYPIRADVIGAYKSISIHLLSTPQLLVLLPRWIFGGITRGASRGFQEIRLRCLMIRTYDFRTLHARYTRDLKRMKDKQKTAPKRTQAEQVANDVRCGFLSKAARKLNSDVGFRDLNDPAVRTKAEALYPKPQTPWSPPPNTHDPWTPAILKCTEFEVFDSLDISLSLFPKGRTPGLSGISYEFLRLLCADTKLRSILKRAVVDLINGKLHPTLQEYMATSLFIPLAKGATAIRPLGVADVFRRWGGVALSLEAKHFGVHTRLTSQYGVGIPCGTEIVHKAINAHLHLHPDHFCAKLDAVNAFNLITREVIFKGAAKLAPFLLPYLYAFYSSPTHLYSHDRLMALFMYEGVQQGDPLGSLLFCIGLHTLLEGILEKAFDASASTSSPFIYLYCDDIFVVGEGDACAIIVKSIQDALPKGGLHLGTERGKMTCFSPAHDTSHTTLPNMGIQRVTCIEVLGAPIGPAPEMAAWLERAIDKHRESIQKHSLIIHSHPHESMELFVKTIVPKLNYTCRCLPVSLPPFQSFVTTSTSLDTNYLLNFLQIPYLHPLLPQHKARLCAVGLPKSHGGGGFRFTHDIMHAAYLGSWVSTYKSCTAHAPHLIPLFEQFWSIPSLAQDAIRDARMEYKDSIEADWKGTQLLPTHIFLDKISTTPPRAQHPPPAPEPAPIPLHYTKPPPSSSSSFRPQKRFTTYQYTTNKQSILSNPDDYRSLCISIRENETGPTTHAWMTAYPNAHDDSSHDKEQVRNLNAEGYRMVYRRRFNMVDSTVGSMLEEGPVTCGKCKKSVTAANSATHLSDCVSSTGGKNWRHHPFRDEVSFAARWAGKDTIPDGSYRKIGRKPKQPDITVTSWLAGTDLCIDTCVASAHCQLPFTRLVSTDQRNVSDPALHTHSTTHRARLKKYSEYFVAPPNAGLLEAGREDNTPEEKRTLKQLTLSDLIGDVFFLPASASSGGSLSPDTTAFLKTCASLAVSKKRIIDLNPVPAFHRVIARRISTALMKGMARNMFAVRSRLTRPGDFSVVSTEPPPHTPPTTYNALSEPPVGFGRHIAALA